MPRMFTPTTEADAAVSSYRLKHTAEKLLAPHCSYVSNGQLIWATAALGLPLVETENGGPNLLVGISEPEHDYVRQLADADDSAPSAPPPSRRPPAPPGRLGTVRRRRAGGPRWVRPSQKAVVPPFHDWLSAQAERDDPVGDIARDYVAGIQFNEHSAADDPDDLLTVLHDASPSPSAYDARADGHRRVVHFDSER